MSTVPSRSVHPPLLSASAGTCSEVCASLSLCCWPSACRRCTAFQHPERRGGARPDAAVTPRPWRALPARPGTHLLLGTPVPTALDSSLHGSVPFPRGLRACRWRRGGASRVRAATSGADRSHASGTWRGQTPRGAPLASAPRLFARSSDPRNGSERGDLDPRAHSPLSRLTPRTGLSGKATEDAHSAAPTAHPGALISGHSTRERTERPARVLTLPFLRGPLAQAGCLHGLSLALPAACPSRPSHGLNPGTRHPHPGGLAPL